MKSSRPSHCPNNRANRTALSLLLAGLFLVLAAGAARAQEDPNDMPLGDVARKFRAKKAPPAAVVVDNDNFSKVVEEAEQQKASGLTMVFSLDPGSKNFQVSSPDVSCSFSFSAKTSSLLSDPALLDELPGSELAKLDGPAILNGDSLQVAVHNGTTWQVREIVIGLTIVRHQESSSTFGQAHLVPAAVREGHSPDSSEKQADSTILLRVKGSAAPSATALFRTQLNFALFPEQEWHWAIVKAKGIPPAAPTAVGASSVQTQAP